MKAESLKIIDETKLESEGSAGAPALPILDEGVGRKKRELPEGAREGEGGTVELTLAWPAAIKFRRPDGSVSEEKFERLEFRRLKGADMLAITGADEKDVMAVALSRGLGIGVGRAQLLFDAMDAADCAAAMQVIGFLSGSGQTTGR